MWSSAIWTRYGIYLKKGTAGDATNYYFGSDAWNGSEEGTSGNGGNGTTLTSASLGVDASVTDFTLSFDVQLTPATSGSSTGAQLSWFVINNADGAAAVTLKSSYEVLVDKAAKWHVNPAIGDSYEVVDNDAKKKIWAVTEDSGNAMLTVGVWYTVTVTSSASGSSISIVPKSGGDALLQSSKFSDAAIAGLGTLVFNTARYWAGFAIDNVVVYK